MANTLNIPERTLAQISAAANSINVIGGADGRVSPYQPLVCRVTNHDDNDAAEILTDTDKMAIFYSRRHGEPWIKDASNLKHIVHNTNDGAAPTDVTILYPDFDYSTFE